MFQSFISDLSVVCGLSLNRSQDEFVISEENLDESEDDPPSNEDSDSEFCARISRRHLSRPMRQSRRLRRKTVKKKYSEDDEDEDSEDNSSRESGEYKWSFKCMEYFVLERGRVEFSVSCHDMDTGGFGSFGQVYIIFASCL